MEKVVQIVVDASQIFKWIINRIDTMNKSIGISLYLVYNAFLQPGILS